MVEPGGFEPLPIKDEIYSLAAVSKTTFSLHLMDAMAGIEPAFTTSKADVLPLDDIAIFFYLVLGTRIELVSFGYQPNVLPMN